MYTTLTPRLIVPDVDAAIAFYVAVFGAEAGMRIATPDGFVVHAELQMAGLTMSLTQSDGGMNRSPAELGGSPAILALMDEDPDAVQQRFEEHGGSVIVPVDDRFYGMRDGRLADPAGHLWLVTKANAHLSEDELNARMTEM